MSGGEAEVQREVQRDPLVPVPEHSEPQTGPKYHLPTPTHPADRA